MVRSESASSSSASLVDRVERLCAAGLDAKRLRIEVLTAVRRVVPFDAHVWLLTDPVTRVGTSPHADVPGLDFARLPAMTPARYLTRVNRWPELLDSGHGAALLTQATGGNLGQSRLWRDFLEDLGVVDAATLAFGDRFGCWAFLDLWRYGPGSPFDERDRRALTALLPSVTRGIREALARTFASELPGELPTGPAVLLLDPDLRVRSGTPGAEDALFRLNPPDDPIPIVPAAAYNVAGALVAEEVGDPVGPPWARVHLAGRHWVTLKAARMATDGDIAVAIEPTSADDRADLFARAHGLSPREVEVLRLLGQGVDSREIARRLVVSEHTANDHVRAVLAKAGTPTRQVLLARAFGAG